MARTLTDRHGGRDPQRVPSPGTSATGGGGSRLRRLWAAIRNARSIYLLLLPAVAWFGVFVYYPAAYGVLASFQTFKLIGPNEWVGFANYARVFSTPGLLNVAINTVVIGVFAGILSIVVPVVIALLLNEITRTAWKKVIQTIIYIPHLFGWVVIAGVWIYVLAMDRGFLNILLERVGLEPVPFMAKAEFGKPLVIFLLNWREFGYLCILYLASITTINPETYEAALMDGAGRLRQAISITLPQLVPTIKILAILTVTQMFKLFDPIWVLRNGSNAYSIDTVMIYLKQFGVDRFQVGYGSAISVLIFLFVLTMTLITKQGLKYQI